MTWFTNSTPEVRRPKGKGEGKGVRGSEWSHHQGEGAVAVLTTPAVLLPEQGASGAHTVTACRSLKAAPTSEP